MYWVIMVNGESYEVYEDYDETFESFKNYCDSHPWEWVELLECCNNISYGGIEML